MRGQQVSGKPSRTAAVVITRVMRGHSSETKCHEGHASTHKRLSGAGIAMSSPCMCVRDWMHAHIEALPHTVICVLGLGYMDGRQDGRRHSRTASLVIARTMHAHSSDKVCHEAREHTQATERSGDRHVIAMHMCGQVACTHLGYHNRVRGW